MIKKIDTIQKLFRNFVRDSKEFNGSVAFSKLLRELPIGDWEKKNAKYNQVVFDYLDRHFGQTLNELFDNFKFDIVEEVENPVIWVMWWQGEENMPEVIRVCYSRLKSVANNIKVNLLTQYTYKDYISLPKVVEEKFLNGQFTITQLSDIIRFLLLKKYGGIWVDAAVYFDHIPEDVIYSRFYTLRAPNMFPQFISTGNWIPGFISVKEKNSIFATGMVALFQEYWEKHDYLIDYLLVDFFIAMLRKHNLNIIKEMENCKENYSFYELNIAVNIEYNEEKFIRMMQRSPIQLLRFRKKTIPYIENGKLTNYGHILEKSGVIYEE